MKNHKNDIKGEFLEFYEFTLCMNFKNFDENSLSLAEWPFPGKKTRILYIR